MVKLNLGLLVLLATSSAFSVSFKEKKQRVAFLEELVSKSAVVSLDSYYRELEYENKNLALSKRAKNEANLLAEKLKLQVQSTYEMELQNKSEDEAYFTVKEAIERDLKLVSPDLQNDIREISLNALESAQSGSMSAESNLENLETVMLKGVEQRHDFLNKDPVDNAQTSFPAAGNRKDAERKEYATKEEVLESLISDRDSIRFVSSSSSSLTSSTTTKSVSNISLQIKGQFLGIDLEIGPAVSFKRQYNTSVTIMGEGMIPLLRDDRNFDFYKKNRAGDVVMKNNVPVRRFIYFTCDADLQFETETELKGSFSVLGIGGSHTKSSTFSSDVGLSSRRILVPDHIAGKTPSLIDLQNLCHNDFLKAKISNNLTIAESLDLSMRNVVASLRFSNPQTKCAQDDHCFKWFNQEIIGLAKINNFPRCIENSKEKYLSCELRGLKGQSCAVISKNGKLLSDGMFEFKCDKGLRCVEVEKAGWFKGLDIYSYAKGKCMPINAGTYRSPKS